METTTTTPPVPWNAIQIIAKDYVTYDPTRALWVDITLDNYGLYGVSTSTDGFTWKDEFYPKSHATASHLRRVVQKLDDKTMVSTQHFIESPGKDFRVTTTCRKS